MKEFDLATLFAVLRELFGPFLWWGLIGLAALTTLAFVVALLRDGGLRSRRLVWSELAGLAGGAGSILFVLWVTNSRPHDIGGPIDWVLMIGIFIAGTVGTALGAYALLGAFRRLA
jgi:hypothetical protein